MYLVVTNSFSQYSPGDIILDNNKIAGVIGSPDVVKVAYIADNGAVVDILASRGLVPAATLPNFVTGTLALGTGATSFVEMVGSGYTRQPISFGPLVGGKATNSATTPFAATGTWPQATQYGLLDATGALLIWWLIAAKFALANGQTSPIAQCAFQLNFPHAANSPGRSALIYTAGSQVGFIGSASINTGSFIQIANGVLSLQTDSQMTASTALTNSVSGTMGTTASIIVPFNAARKSLMITNRTSGTETQDIGSSNVTVGGGIPLQPGGGFLFNGAGAAGPIYGITTTANSAFSYVEG